MNALEWIKRLTAEKKWVTLTLMLLCGAALIALSLMLSEPSEARPEDIAYTEGSVEKRLEHVLSMIEGAGQVEVLVTQSESGVVGVLVVADGAQELSVRTDLTRAAMTALDIPAQSVEVFARKREGN